MRLAHHIMTYEGWYHKNNQPLDLDFIFADIKAAGYDGVEIGGDEITMGTPDSLRRKLADHGLEAAAVAIAVTATPWPPNTEEYRRALDYAGALGIKTIMVCGGCVPEPRRTMIRLSRLLNPHASVANS